VLLFEIREWWDDTSERRGGPAREELSGPARFREPGTTGVRLLGVGGRPEAVARRLRYVTDLDDAAVADLMARVPVALPTTLSLRSAERVVDGLRNAGADAQLRIHGTPSVDSSVDPSVDPVGGS
jgi:hypothetical protein